MDERGNKTIMCSVLFLDIAEYSKMSVSVQISLKDRFNGYLSSAIRDVPITDRIILDTGDGAAINFLGDVEDALKTAVNLRESLLQDVNADPPLLVRMGINLGPVRLVRDINGQPNIVGDGINVAQRVMGFADVAQILVSRSYYDAVSRLSSQYAGMFHYQGSRTDKHVREHEVYAIGSGSRGAQVAKRPPISPERKEFGRVTGRTSSPGNSFSVNLHLWMEHLSERFRQAEPAQRVLYVGIAAVPFVLIVALMFSMVRQDKISSAPGSLRAQAGDLLQAGSAVEPAPGGAVVKDAGPASEVPEAAPKAKERKQVERKKKPGVKARREEAEGAAEVKRKAAKPKTKEEAAKKAEAFAPSEKAGTFVSVTCKGAELFVDGNRKGRIAASPLTVAVSPGKHTVIINHAKGISSQDIVFAAGKTVRLSPDFCK